LNLASSIAMADAAIRVEGLKKRFGTLAALDGVAFDVAPATVFGLLGPNGAGKTTAVRVLATILLPDEGRAEVLGYDVVRQASAVRSRIGLAGQFAAVDANLTGRENLRLVGRLGQLPRGIIAPRAAELLERFDLSDAGDRPVKTYSGGMRRRLDVAASLMQRPPVLFLDEPTTGLDLQSREALWDMIRELVGDGTTVLLTTQYLEEADRLADRIAVVAGGKVIANDTPDRLKSRLGSTVIEVGMQDEEQARSAAALLSPLIDGEPEVEGTLLRLSSGDGAHILINALRALDGADMSPVSLTVREPSLDDVFLNLTGKHAEAEEKEAERAQERRTG
jgi:daunorubicin resistance ABC transporter ATP-binding subunit